jgi:putative tricarboxylic transport membrane protein
MIWDQAVLALAPYMIFICLLGVTLGILWGAMPGLSTTMAMALLIGLSAGMGQNVAIMFMLGVYTGSVFGGAISAVLINIPGTPDAVPTMIEGHTLAMRGEGGLALGTAIASSFLGNWVGILLLITFIPAILALALQFKSWEMFLLSIWGIAICGSMSSGERPLKGWISGWVGLLISFVGLDSIHAVPRYTFGVRTLEDGISYIPILIGLFGLTEILRVLPQKSPVGIPTEVGRVVPPFSTERSSAPSPAPAPTSPLSWPTISASGGPARKRRKNGAREVTRPSSAPRSPTTPMSADRCCRHLPSAYQGTPRRRRFWRRWK